MVVLKSLYKVFNEGTVNRSVALEDIDITINEGDFITIIGSNGAGKTTLFNSISGNSMSTSGTILLDRRDVTRHPEHRRANYIGRIFQDPLLGTAGELSIEENMSIAHKKGFRWLGPAITPDLRRRFRDELSHLEMGLEERLTQPVGLLSGGQRQAMTLLMTVLSRPRLLLLDEHTAALDPRNAARILELTDRFISEYRLTAMMITHNMQQAIEYGNRLLMMHKGRIIYDVSGDQKKNLSVEMLVDKFHQVTHGDLTSDEVLLT
jgi:putative ABC transport system ATP-binding protein